MKELVYQGPGSKTWMDVSNPIFLEDTDAAVRVDSTTICGTELLILKRRRARSHPRGRILDHEAVGTVERIGSLVKTVAVGNRILVSCILARGTCRYCRDRRYGQRLGGGGWILGHMIDSAQAKRVRVSFADTSTYKFSKSACDARQVRDRTSQDALDPRRYDHNATRRHVLDADVVETGLIEAARRPALCHPRFAPEEIEEVYDTFARAGETGALKVVLAGVR
ncbi:MAG: alcohol dehydrogenase catalytic domain-containing protein [Acidimicrobiales bacterium]